MAIIVIDMIKGNVFEEAKKIIPNRWRERTKFR